MKKYLYLILVIALGCSPSPNAQEIIDNSIDQYGQVVYNTSQVKFRFRDREYTSTKTQEGQMIYLREFQDSIFQIKDSLVNASKLTRFKDGIPVDLDEEWHGKYQRSVNSVLYFNKIPLVANDPAVIKEYIGSVVIEEKPYYAIKITFRQEGGGDDFEDEFRYWINKDNYQLDFIAYNYQTDEGGTRFRKAINQRRVGKLLVQDYINYAPTQKFPPLDSLPVYFERGDLKELSRIINEDFRISSF